MASSIRFTPRRPSRASRPVRTSRTQVQSYHEDSSSDDRGEELDSDDEQARRLSLSLRPRDSHRMPVTYREESSDDEFDGDASGSEDPAAIVPTEAPAQIQYSHAQSTSRNTTSSTPRRRTVRTRSQANKPQRRSTKKRLELGRPLNKRRKVEEDGLPIVGSGVIPPWQSLPYHILFDIFLRASYPLVDERTRTRHSSVQWLVKISLLCRAFHEPALAALYHCPPLIPDAKSHGLLSLVSKPQELFSTNYVSKIRELDIDVEQLLLYKSGPTLGYFDLPKLVEKTPQVKRLRLYHARDHQIGLPIWEIPTSKWNYPEALFSAITKSSIRLRSWDWNRRFLETKTLIPLMMAKHLEPAFSGLRELKLLHVAERDDPNANDEDEVVLATALKELPELRRLEFFECSILNEHLLPILPLCLTSLSIYNCANVTTVNMSAFLTTHGQTLRELTLCHNRHLSLSFIVNLAQSCPRLEKFKVDISMHDLSSYHDVEPHFRDLLGRSEVPTWPASLQDIEMHQLSKWDGVAAEVFLTSLIDAAPELRNLRRIMITAILKIGWRDRASFREKWISRLERVFLRRSAPPDPNLYTIPRPAQEGISHQPESTVDDVASPLDAPGSGPSTPSKRKSARLAQRKFSELEDYGELSPSGRAQTDGEEDENPLPHHGMCDVVTLRIDNQRPTEMQFNEQDFLDDELSGDEDWDGRDVDVGDGSHAW